MKKIITATVLIALLTTGVSGMAVAQNTVTPPATTTAAPADSGAKTVSTDTKAKTGAKVKKVKHSKKIKKAKPVSTPTLGTDNGSMPAK